MLTTPEAVARLEHRRDACNGQIITRLRDDARTVTTCRGCGAKVFHDEDDGPAEVVPDSTPWRCREHLARVTWRGTGCPDCAAEHRTRQQRRAALRAKRLAAERARRAQPDHDRDWSI